MHHRLSDLLGAMTPFVIRSAVTNAGLKAASFVSAPPYFAPRAGWVVIRCAGVAAIVPFSSHLRAQGPKGVANTSFASRAARTAMALVQGARACSPSVRPPLGTMMADPVADFLTSAAEVIEIQAFCDIQL